MEYLKYLSKRPLKIMWLLFIYTFITCVEYITWSNEDDSNGLTDIGIHLFMLVIFCLGSYQPYKEYKDGLR